MVHIGRTLLMNYKLVYFTYMFLNFDAVDIRFKDECRFSQQNTSLEFGHKQPQDLKWLSNDNRTRLLYY